MRYTFKDVYISIHALREEGDEGTAHPGNIPAYFYPRPPRGGRPGKACPVVRDRHFYPRPPRGGRPLILTFLLVTAKFLSTPSARRATLAGLRHRPQQRISIHALREEGDRAPVEYGCALGDFYPRPPRGGRRRVEPEARQANSYFYPRPPRGGRPLK